MAKLKLSARQKMETTAARQGLPRVIEITDEMSQRWGTGTCVIPDPMEVDGIMRSVPLGRLITINQIRAKLAQKHGATIG